MEILRKINAPSPVPEIKESNSTTDEGSQDKLMELVVPIAPSAPSKDDI